MSRYTRFKDSYERIVDRPATLTEKKLLCGLSMVRKAYDINFIERRKVTRALLSKYGKEFAEKLRLATNDRKRGVLFVKHDCDGLIDEYFRLDYLEKQIYYISKNIRKGIGLEIDEQEIPPDITPRADYQVSMWNKEKECEIQDNEWEERARQ